MISKREALRIHALLLEEANRLRPKPHINNKDITKDEALKVITQRQLDYILKAQEVFNGIIFERRTRGGRRYCL